MGSGGWKWSCLLLLLKKWMGWMLCFFFWEFCWFSVLSLDYDVLMVQLWSRYLSFGIIANLLKTILLNLAVIWSLFMSINLFVEGNFVSTSTHLYESLFLKFFLTCLLRYEIIKRLSFRIVDWIFFPFLFSWISVDVCTIGLYIRYLSLQYLLRIFQAPSLQKFGT